MGKGMLSPDTKTLEGCHVPVFKAHPTPINIAVRPDLSDIGVKKGSPKKRDSSSPRTRSGRGGDNNADAAAGRAGSGGPQPGSSGCGCVIL